MIDVGIDAGDLIVEQKQNTATRSGSIEVALADNQTILKIYIVS